MPHQSNSKYLSTEKTMVVSKDGPKFFGLPVTCGIQRINSISLKLLAVLKFFAECCSFCSTKTFESIDISIMEMTSVKFFDNFLFLKKIVFICFLALKFLAAL